MTIGDVRAQIEHQAYSPIEIAARYHHRLVAIVWTTLEELNIAAKGFLDPILADERGIWDPTKWVWKTHEVQITSGCNRLMSEHLA
jgi:hypothetical protein